MQGVGFRPHVYRLAQKLGLTGWVRNCTGLVEIHIQGQAAAIEIFVQQVIETAPALAHPHLKRIMVIPDQDVNEFSIIASVVTNEKYIHIPPDVSLCHECLVELYTPTDWRYHYSFINCTQCGPRYTLIHSLPYARAATTMAEFALCAHCQSEYANPLSRRFHAEPLACTNCGPSLYFHAPNTAAIDGNIQALQACITALHKGAIVAVRGIGGYHLCCDAKQDVAIARLRQHKPRPAKPLAVMFPAPIAQPLQEISAQVQVTAEAAALLLSPIHPIVLLRRRADCCLSLQIAPGLNELGVLLPYSPLHHLLINELGKPLVVTSANLSGEPILTDPNTVESRLSHVAEAFLHHNRPIARPNDDSIYRYSGGKFRPLRLGRGNAPLELSLPVRLREPVLATGSQNKNTVALAWEQRVIISPHLGDLSTARSLAGFERTIADLQTLYGVKAKILLCDAHPNYASSRWARREALQHGLSIHKFFHHHAHAAAVYGEAKGSGDWLIFTWDGIGYGADGNLWGGEAWLGQPGKWQRFATLRPFFLPGGEQASREPWRSAAALCWETGREMLNLPPSAQLVKHAWERKLNCPQTTAAGRIFDAAAALLGLCHTASFDGQAAMLLEAICAGDPAPLELPLYATETGLWVSDWEPLLPMLQNDAVPPATKAACLHASLAQVLLQQARLARQLHHISQIGLAGGVFQNRIVTDQAIELLTNDGFTVFLPAMLPINDAGISYGQIIEFSILEETNR